MSGVVEQVSAAIGDLKNEFNVIAHNLANVTTVGYKRRYNTFSKALMAQGAGTGEMPPADGSPAPAFDFSQGAIQPTGRPLDIALGGKGFFVIETPEGPLYTRNGMFSLDKDMRIVDMSERVVASDSGPIVVPSDVGLSQVNVSDDGSVSAAGLLIGKFKVVDFGEDEKQLVPVGDCCFQAPEDIRPKDAEGVVVKQGCQESSNVEMVEEMVDMIMVSRLYEANMQFVSVKRDAGKSLTSVAMG